MRYMKVAGAQQLRHRMAELAERPTRQSLHDTSICLSPQALRGLATAKRGEADAAARHLPAKEGYPEHHPSAVAYRAEKQRITRLRTQADAFERQADELESEQ